MNGMPFLTKKRQNQIDAVISNLTLNLGAECPEITIVEILSKLDIKAYFAGLPPQISGLIQKENDILKIFINESQSKERRVFTLAHELGHFKLHEIPEAGKFRVDKYDYSIESKEAIEETEANYFAGALLVPKETLLKMVKLTNEKKLIADYFGVSEIVITNRINWIRQNG